MSKKAIIGLFVGILLLSSNTTKAEAASLDDALKRMDAIISEMQALRAEFAALAGQATSNSGIPSVLGVQTSNVFTQSLAYGETNDDIKKIQRLLATDSEIYPYGVASGFFGPKTQEAIRNLQTRFGLDPVGVIGPATTALLSSYFQAYPDENFPEGVLSTRPTVPTSSSGDNAQILKELQSRLSTLTNQNTADRDDDTDTARTSGGDVDTIEVVFDGSEAQVTVEFSNGDERTIIVDSRDEDDVIEEVARRLSLRETDVRDVIDFSDIDSRSSSSRKKDVSDDDASEAIDDADRAIENAEDEISDAEDDGKDVDYAEDTLDDAKKLYSRARSAYKDEEFDDAYEYANDAEDLAHEAEDRIDEEFSRDSDEIDELTARVADEMAKVLVVYANGDEEKITIREDQQDNIISELADELDIDESDVEDIIEFEYEDLDTVDVNVKDDGTFVKVEYEDGTTRRFTIDEDDEDDIISKVADLIDERESVVEDALDIEYYN